MLARAIAAETGATGSLLAVRDFATSWPAANILVAVVGGINYCMV